MNCNEVREHLSALIDGEVTEARRAQVDAHLATCGACARERDSLMSLGQSMRAWETSPLNVFAASRISDALKAHAGGTKEVPARLWKQGAALGVAAAAAVAVLTIVMNVRNEIAPPARDRIRIPLVRMPFIIKPSPMQPPLNETILPRKQHMASRPRTRAHRAMPVPVKNEAERHQAEVPDVAARGSEGSYGTDTGVALLAAVLTETTTTTFVTSAPSPTLERELLDMMTETR